MLQTLSSRAADLNLILDAQFTTAIIKGVKNLGVLNPKIPDAFCQAPLKTLSPKIQPGRALPGISVFSVPVLQRYDYAGGYMEYFRAFRFLITALEMDGVECTLIDDVLKDGPMSAALLGHLGSSWAQAVTAIKDHLERNAQCTWVNKDEKQVFFSLDGCDEYLLISPQADALPIELASRMRRRKALPESQIFPKIRYQAGGTKPQGSGVMTNDLAGFLPKLFVLPSQSSYKPKALPGESAGNYLALEFNAQQINVTGAGIVAGPANVVSSLGFLDALRRTLKLDARRIAFGFSEFQFDGLYEDSRWAYFQKKSIRKAAAGKVIAYPVPEMTASSRVHILIELQDTAGEDLAVAAANALHSMRFAGGAIWHPDAAIYASKETVLAHWAGVWVLADRQHEIADAADKLDAALDKLALVQDKKAWVARRPQYALAVTGYQGIEPPRQRDGLRDRACKHMYAASISGLTEWVRAEASAVDLIFWKSVWNRTNYTGFCTAAHEPLQMG